VGYIVVLGWWRIFSPPWVSFHGLVTDRLLKSWNCFSVILSIPYITHSINWVHLVYAGNEVKIFVSSLLWILLEKLTFWNSRCHWYWEQCLFNENSLNWSLSQPRTARIRHFLLYHKEWRPDIKSCVSCVVYFSAWVKECDNLFYNRKIPKSYSIVSNSEDNSSEKLP
jgi:hypothetical protein